MSFLTRHCDHAIGGMFGLGVPLTPKGEVNKRHLCREPYIRRSQKANSIKVRSIDLIYA